MELKRKIFSWTMYSIINLYFLLHDEFCLLYVPLEQLWYWWNVRVFATIAWRNATHKLTKVDENFNHSLLLFIFAAQAPIMRLCLCAPCGLDQGASANQDTGLKLQFLFYHQIQIHLLFISFEGQKLHQILH